jgi:demethylmenaquinone methyltransferase/2-methoxy-6-polyprenyl-1,4-benzoquinol methylase
MSQEILQEQIEYYRKRTGEYDEWFYRKGRYDRGAELNQLWFDEATQVRQELLQTPPVGNALELACGTGIWTQELVKVACNITALDASPEVIEINRAKLTCPVVSYELVDLFKWEPQQQYELVFFSFWLSHVPPELLTAFLNKVYRATKPGGRCFLIDSRLEPTSTAKDTPLHNIEHIYYTRKLNDGSFYKVVKIFYEQAGLSESLSATGFVPDIKVTPHYFIYGIATRPS